MYCVKKITSDLYWVGANDRRLAMFEGVYSVPDGVSYNSYLLMDEHTVLFDTVDKAVGKVFFENIEHVLGDRKLDYVVVQHMEPDHSATLKELVLRYPDVTVVCNKLTSVMMKQFFNSDFNMYVVDEKSMFNTGRHSFAFVMAPMVHWPEVMVTYDKTDKILFSADAFGCFGAINGAIFADEVDFERDYLDEARRYYCNIVGKYGPQVTALLEKASSLKIDMICPLHGFVWRKRLGDFISKYQLWATYTPEVAGVMIAYASVYGNTENVAEIISSKLRDKGIKTVMYDVSTIPASDIIAASFKYSHLVFASTTYNAGIFISMEALLRDLAEHNIQKRTVAFVQNGSWAPTSGKLMREIMAECSDITVIDSDITVKSSLKETQLAEIEDLTDKIASSVKAMIPERKTGEGEVMMKIPYGLYVLTARDSNKDNGCIINTFQQVTSTPNRVSVTVNKKNYTCQMIEKTGVFNVSVLTEDTPFSIFTHFGFQSGATVDKFDGFEDYERTSNGLTSIEKYSNSVISAKVIASQDYGTHIMFVADVTEAKYISGAPSLTYSYYHSHIKPKPAPKKDSSARIWVCKICGYEYDESKGDPQNNIPAGTKFEDLPDDWVCPLCKHPKSDFVLK